MILIQRAQPRFFPLLKSVARLNSTSVPSEIAKFGELAGSWWDPSGPMAALHAMNAVRVPWIRAALEEGGAGGGLGGLRVLDAGCGAGLLSEALARLGATVTGLDASAEALAAAEAHRRQAHPDGLPNLAYRQGTVEELGSEERGSFHAVVASEVVEHLGDRRLFLSACAEVLRPGGQLFLTTINRTIASRLLAITVAEDILRIVPPGTHEWHQFVPPEDLSRQLEEVGLTVRSLLGLAYNPLLARWFWTPNLSLNYALSAQKPLA